MEINIQKLIMDAFNGDADAQLDLGNCYLHGWNIEKDEISAVSWYEKAAEQNYAKAQYNLGLCYANGWGVPQDADKAFFWYKKSADNKYPDAIYKVGLFYLEGISVIQDFNLGFKNISQAAQSNIPLAVHDMGVCYANGWGVVPNIETARECFIKAAELDAEDGKCKFLLGNYYLSGVYFEPNDENAFYWINEAAMQQYPDACIQVGELYYSGIGCKKCERRAARFWKSAADSGNPDALYKIAACYESGECGFPENKELSSELYYRAANSGSSEAQLKCAIDYISKDEPSDNDYENAYKWLVKASELNNAVAKYILAGFYYEGKIVTKSVARACELYQDAVNLGCEDAVTDLISCYKYGGNDMSVNENIAKKLAEDFNLNYNDI